MIDYSLGARLSKPNDKNSEKKVYAYAQARQVIDIMALARHIQVHGSPYTRDIIVGVLTKAVDCIREQLLEGNKVQLGEMGAFYVTLRSTGADSADDFNAGANITGVNVRWERGKSYEEMIADASFRYVATREKQADKPVYITTERTILLFSNIFSLRQHLQPILRLRSFFQRNTQL